MGLWRVEISGVCAGQGIINVMHFGSGNGGGMTEAADLANRIVANWIDYVRYVQFRAMVYQKVKCTQLEGATQTVFELPLLLSGMAADTVRFSPVTSIVLKFKKPSAGRHGRGRIYLAGCGGDDMDKGLWTPSKLNQLTDLCVTMTTFWVTPGGTQPFWLMLMPRGGNPLDAVTVEQIVPRAVCGFQRRRNIGVGI